MSKKPVKDDFARFLTPMERLRIKITAGFAKKQKEEELKAKEQSQNESKR